MTPGTQWSGPARGHALRAAVLGVVGLLAASAVSIPSRSAGADTAAATSTTSTTSTTTATPDTLPASASGPTTTTTAPQTAIISVNGEATTTTTTAPAAPAPASEASPPGATLTVIPPTASLQPVGDDPPATPAASPDAGTPPETPPAPSLRPTPVVRPLAPPTPRQVPKLLDAAAARRRDLNARVVEAESTVARLDVELGAAHGVLPPMQAEHRELLGRLGGVEAQLRELEQPAPPQAATLAAPGPTESKASPPSKSKNPVAAVLKRVVDTGRNLLRDEPSDAVLVADGVRTREEQLRHHADLTASASDLRQRLAASEGRIAAAGAVQAAKAHELQASRLALAEARQHLSAALADVNFGPLAMGTALDGVAQPSAFALADIPPGYTNLYQAGAATCPGLPWTVLAAIGSIESAHGRSAAPGVHEGANFAGAMGPMQFMPPTWAAYGLDGDGDGVRDVYNATDAVYGAANYLCASGGADPGHLAGAIWNYNHADWYVRDVLDLAGRYGEGGLHRTVVDGAQLVANPNLTLSPQARADLLSGVVDQQVVDALGAIVARHKISISVIETGHAMHVKGTDRVSNHFYGRAVDIHEVDGAPVSAANDAAMELAVALLTAESSVRPDELGSPWPELGQFPGAFSDADHLGHLHLGWRA